jgi:protease-4
MKNFIKMTFATVTGLVLFSFVALFISIALIGAVAALGEKQPVMPSKAMMVIDMSTIMLSEQTTETDILTALQSTTAPVAPLGIYSAINAINAAATDPAIRFIYIKPDGSMSGVAHMEELRTALENFRKSGKAVV